MGFFSNQIKEAAFLQSTPTVHFKLSELENSSIDVFGLNINSQSADITALDLWNVWSGQKRKHWETEKIRIDRSEEQNGIKQNIDRPAQLKPKLYYVSLFQCRRETNPLFTFRQQKKTRGGIEPYLGDLRRCISKNNVLSKQRPPRMAALNVIPGKPWKKFTDLLQLRDKGWSREKQTIK